MNHIHSEHRSQRALITGAGIAGLTAATRLRRTGWDVDVIERGNELRAGGYKVDARGAGTEVLRRLGIEGAARERATAIRAGSIVTGDGKVVAAMGGDTFGGRESEDIELERGDLLHLLADVAGDVRYDTTVASLTQDAGGVDVTFRDGTTARYDVILGADGVRSSTRAIAGLDAPLRHLGYGIAVTTLPDRAGLDREEATYVEPGATALMYATATSDRARAMLLFRHDGELPREPDARRALLRKAYARQGWRVPEILSAFEADPTFYLDTVSQVELPRWSQGRVGLIGDAAHAASPASGQGTTLGLVGGWTTAALLAARPEDPAAALAEAERRLRPLAEANQKLGRGNIGRMVLPSDRAITSTLMGLRVINALHLSKPILGQVARSLAKASRFELPE